MTVLISANFVIGSMVPSILPAASRVFRGERARPRERQKEILEFSSQRRKEMIAEKHQAQWSFTEPCTILQPSLLRPLAFDLQTNIIFLINLSSIFIKVFVQPWTLPPAGHCMLCAHQNVFRDVSLETKRRPSVSALLDLLSRKCLRDNLDTANSSIQCDYSLSSIRVFYSSPVCTIPCPPHYMDRRKFCSYIFPFVNLLEKVPLSEETHYAHRSRL